MSVGILSCLTLSMDLAEIDSSCKNLCIRATGHALWKGAVIHIHRQMDTAVSSAVGNFYTAIVFIELTHLRGTLLFQWLLGPLEEVKAACFTNSQGCILTQKEGGCWCPADPVTNY